MAVAPEMLRLSRHLRSKRIRQTLRQNPDLRERIRELRDNWHDDVRRWCLNRTCELGSAEHRRQIEPINNEVGDKLDNLLGFHIPVDDLNFAFEDALRTPSRSRSRSRFRSEHSRV